MMFAISSGASNPAWFVALWVTLGVILLIVRRWRRAKVAGRDDSEAPPVS